jgi:mono/diheme cytochrome c family protein
LQEGTWLQPTSLHSDNTRAMTTGQLYEALTNGIRTMPSYKAMLTPKERWAVVAYVRALQSTSKK